jgi:hypothetical protein
MTKVGNRGLKGWKRPLFLKRVKRRGLNQVVRSPFLKSVALVSSSATVLVRETHIGSDKACSSLSKETLFLDAKVWLYQMLKSGMEAKW